MYNTIQRNLSLYVLESNIFQQQYLVLMFHSNKYFIGPQNTSIVIRNLKLFFI